MTQLKNAILRHDNYETLRLLANGVDPNETNNRADHDTPSENALFTALRANNNSIIPHLLEYGADPQQPHAGMFTPLHYAVTYSPFPIVKMLIHKAIEIKKCKNQGLINLINKIAACFYKKPKIKNLVLLTVRNHSRRRAASEIVEILYLLEELLDNFTELITHPLQDDEDTALTAAISPLYNMDNLPDPVEVVQAILIHSNNASVNKPNGFGYTPMMLAAMSNHSWTIAALHQAGGNINEQCSARICSSLFYGQEREVDGMTPLIFSIITRKIQSTKMLLQLGANTEIPDDKGNTAAYYACKYRNFEALKLLKEYNANLLVTSRQEETLLHAAALGAHYPTIEYLMHTTKIERDKKDLSGDVPTRKLLSTGPGPSCEERIIAAEKLSNIPSLATFLCEEFNEEVSTAVIDQLNAYIGTNQRDNYTPLRNQTIAGINGSILTDAIIEQIAAVTPLRNQNFDRRSWLLKTRAHRRDVFRFRRLGDTKKEPCPVEQTTATITTEQAITSAASQNIRARNNHWWTCEQCTHSTNPSTTATCEACGAEKNT